MKLLLLLLVVFVAVWVWRSGRLAARRTAAPPTPPPATPQEMVRCALCGMHLPKSEALNGRQGVYCGAEHLQRAES